MRMYIVNCVVHPYNIANYKRPYLKQSPVHLADGFLIMALFRRAKPGNLGRDFRSNKHLQKFVLYDVTSTGKSLGTGSYGSVEEVIRIHTVLLNL